MHDKYRDYFAIDPEYFPVVNEDVITKNPEMWKKFYPHVTFVKLIKDVVNVLNRKQKLSLWVEGAYGTGKSHAVLTLKKLLDASDVEAQEYFNKYNLDKDLCQSFQKIKEDGTILTVHRYGSASIRSDHNLVFAVQESIEKALQERGIKNKGCNALKDATLTWLLDASNKAYFDSLVTNNYSELFGGDNADAVIKKLSTYSGAALATVMDNIFKVADARQLKMLSMNVAALCQWIKEVIKANGLKAIVFIWDEFTEYFYNNSSRLTGFQELCELSETEPFYFVLVTHVSSGLFHNRDQDFIKLNGRFVAPHSVISLPENIAFQLMGAAMEKNQDKAVLDDWNATLEDLINRTKDARKIVQNVAKITDREMLGILPIHPHTALLLKYMSAAFDSNQRSMFDFIKNDRGDEIKGFQWFIDNYGPLDDNPLLTIDMLWDFFYEKGKQYLVRDIRSILDYFDQTSHMKLSSDEQRVLKAVLLLQAISLNSGNSVELFIPNSKNINNVFEGSDLDGDSASRCAQKLVRDKVLYEKPLGGGKMQYCAYSSDIDIDLDVFLKKVDQTKTTNVLIQEQLSDGSSVADVVALGGALKLRYELKNVSLAEFKSSLTQLRNSIQGSNKIPMLVAFAKDDTESVAIGKEIGKALNEKGCPIVFIDASKTPLGQDRYEQYRRYMALSFAQNGKDNAQSKQNADNAREELRKWKNSISNGEFILYWSDNTTGERVASLDALYRVLKEINRARYPQSLECAYSVTDEMFKSTSLQLGTGCGAEQLTKGSFRSSNVTTKLEGALDGAWKIDNYWDKKPGLLISKIKREVESLIKRGFAQNGRVSMREIYDLLKVEPYGFRPCNLTAFVLGFLLKEYVNGAYSYSDNLNSVVLTVDKLKEMVAETINQEITQNPRYRDKYIVTVSEEEKAFNEMTAQAFDISDLLCSSVPNTRSQIRTKMKEFSFPIWTVKSLIPNRGVKTDPKVLEQIIDLYCGIANNNNIDATKSENDFAIELGHVALKYPHAGADLKGLFSKDQCTCAMEVYLESFEEGELVSLAQKVGDGGQFINVLRQKFDAQEAAWLWNVDTVQQKIREVTLEYRIILESSKIIGRETDFKKVISAWKDKCNNIRVSFEVAKGHVDGLEPFLQMLLTVSRSLNLDDSQKESFLELIKLYGESFLRLYDNQIELFKAACAFSLSELNDDEIQNIYKLIPNGSFFNSKADYINKVSNRVEEYRANQKSSQLKKLWKEKTGSDSPRDWSKEHNMPLLCLVNDGEYSTAKMAFDTINKPHPDNQSVEKALDYLTSAESLFTKMADSEALDKAFCESVIKDNAVMLSDLNEVKKYLLKQVSTDPYEWSGLPAVDKKLKEMAENKYLKGGSAKALEVIDSMNTDELKRYLKQLIKDNAVVGMEIIKSR